MADFMSYSVYWIRHPEHTDIFSQGYVGISKHFERRMLTHKKFGNAHLRNAINKYGWDNLKKEILLVADEAYCLTIETLLRAENSVGWNIVKGGGKPPINKRKGYKVFNVKRNSSMFVKGNIPWNKGLPMSTNTKQKISISRAGILATEVTKRKMAISRTGEKNPMYGKITSPTAKLKQSLAKLGKPSPRKGILHSDKSKLKMRLRKLGKSPTIETREKQKQKMTGYIYTLVECPHCKKVGGLTGMKSWHFNNCKFKETQ